MKPSMNSVLAMSAYPVVLQPFMCHLLPLQRSSCHFNIYTAPSYYPPEGNPKVSYKSATSQLQVSYLLLLPLSSSLNPRESKLQEKKRHFKGSAAPQTHAALCFRDRGVIGEHHSRWIRGSSGRLDPWQQLYLQAVKSPIYSCQRCILCSSLHNRTIRKSVGNWHYTSGWGKVNC